MDFLLEGFRALGEGENWKYIVMWVIGALLILLAIRFKLEPALLLPLGFGTILVNISPLSGVIDQGETGGIIESLYKIGIQASEAMPLLLFIGIGAMIDFGPLLANPKLLFFGGAAQIGIFITILLASACGFDFIDAVATGIIGAADGPTSIAVANALGSKFVGAITVAAYSYMALVPIIQPLAIRLCTTKKERAIKMEYNPQSVSKLTKILFPIVVTMIAGLVAPASVALVGFLMFGNLIRESGILDNLTEAASKTLSNLITLLLGITIAFSMRALEFLQWQTVVIMCLGLVAFVFDTVGGVMFAKFLNLFTRKKMNPMIGAAGISAFPMSARVVQRMGLKADPSNHLLMHAVGANVSGQIASVIAGGIILGIML